MFTEIQSICYIRQHPFPLPFPAPPRVEFVSCFLICLKFSTIREIIFTTKYPLPIGCFKLRLKRNGFLFTIAEVQREPNSLSTNNGQWGTKAYGINEHA